MTPVHRPRLVIAGTQSGVGKTTVTLALLAALKFLGQMPPAELAYMDCAAVWDWAKSHWQLQRVPQQRVLPAQTIF